MKKLFFIAILAITGANTAFAYGKWMNFNCPDGFHYPVYVEIQDDLDEAQEEELLEDYRNDMMAKLCGED